MNFHARIERAGNGFRAVISDERFMTISSTFSNPKRAYYAAFRAHRQHISNKPRYIIQYRWRCFGPDQTPFSRWLTYAVCDRRANAEKFAASAAVSDHIFTRQSRILDSGPSAICGEEEAEYAEIAECDEEYCTDDY